MKRSDFPRLYLVEHKIGRFSLLYREMPIPRLLLEFALICAKRALRSLPGVAHTAVPRNHNKTYVVTRLYGPSYRTLGSSLPQSWIWSSLAAAPLAYLGISWYGGGLSRANAEYDDLDRLQYSNAGTTALPSAKP